MAAFLEDPMLLVVVVGLALAPAVLLLTLVLHFTIPKRLKSDLVNERYFNAFELDLEFPGSVFRSLAIARAVAFPQTMRKRFGSYDFASASTWQFRWICRLYLGLLMLTFALVLTMAVPELVKMVGEIFS